MAIRFLMVGGFLGAGKTTTLARLARMFQEQGRSVGIVTNDQAGDLVDTFNLRAQGFEVGEVTGSCFCCNFGGLTDAVTQLGEGGKPDVVLTEPVGSCTDLVATVIQPLLKHYPDDYEIAPYAVLLKPSHGLKILSGGEQAGFSFKAEYIFRKQLEEADLIVINRIDELAPDEVQRLTALLESQFPDRPVLRVSARTGEGFTELFHRLSETPRGRRTPEVDYDIYAEGEAELGWLNSTAHLNAPEPFDLDRLLLDLTVRLRDAFLTSGTEPAHLKISGDWAGVNAVANLVSSTTPAELSRPSGASVQQADLIVNARVATDPALLSEQVHAALAAEALARNALVRFGHSQSFRPGRPVPTHRIPATV